MPSLFEPTVINGMALRNRIVRSATAEGLATADGAATAALEAMLAAFAAGGVGLAAIQVVQVGWGHLSAKFESFALGGPGQPNGASASKQH